MPDIEKVLREFASEYGKSYADAMRVAKKGTMAGDRKDAQHMLYSAISATYWEAKLDTVVEIAKELGIDLNIGSEE